MVKENKIKNYKNNKKCVDCNTEIMDRSIRCNKCNPNHIVEKYIKGKRSSNYIDGRTLKKHYCIDCGKKISYGAKRCHKCADSQHSKRMTGKNNSMFGKRHTEAVKKKMGINHSSLKGKNNGMFGRIAIHAKGNYYKNIYMRSSWEVLFAQFLDLSGIKWQYEPKTFDLGNSTYTPDFYIQAWNGYIEIKGFWRGNAKEKFNKFKRLHPEINIILFNKLPLEEIGVI